MPTSGLDHRIAQIAAQPPTDICLRKDRNALGSHDVHWPRSVAAGTGPGMGAFSYLHVAPTNTPRHHLRLLPHCVHTGMHNHPDLSKIGRNIHTECVLAKIRTIPSVRAIFLNVGRPDTQCYHNNTIVFLQRTIDSEGQGQVARGKHAKWIVLRLAACADDNPTQNLEKGRFVPPVTKARGDNLGRAGGYFGYPITYSSGQWLNVTKTPSHKQQTAPWLTAQALYYRRSNLAKAQIQCLSCLV